MDESVPAARSHASSPQANRPRPAPATHKHVTHTWRVVYTHTEGGCRTCRTPMSCHLAMIWSMYLCGGAQPQGRTHSTARDDVYRPAKGLSSRQPTHPTVPVSNGRIRLAQAACESEVSRHGCRCGLVGVMGWRGSWGTRVKHAHIHVTRTCTTRRRPRCRRGLRSTQGVPGCEDEISPLKGGTNTFARRVASAPWALRLPEHSSKPVRSCFSFHPRPPHRRPTAPRAAGRSCA
jgi:hypothetical protein